ncbi:type II toxin-antitoxin system RelE/ParE family toxin [soil metagenome]
MEYFGFTESERFVKRAEKLLGAEMVSELQLYLCRFAEDGVIIPASGGIRKLRWAASGRGKRGGARIIYYFANAAGRIFLLDIYAKNEKENLTADDIKDLKEAVEFWLEELKRLGEI